MDQLTREELINTLETERILKIASEEECKRLKDLLNQIEEQVKVRTQELLSTKQENESKLCNMCLELGKYKANELVYKREIENMRTSLHNLSEDYIKANDEGISKASQIEELYLSISQHRNEITSLREQISLSQANVLSLSRDNQSLLRILEKKKTTKFCQTDISWINYTGLESPLNMFNSSQNSKSNSYSIRSLPLDDTLRKAKTQMLTLQKSKARLDMQIRLLSSFTEDN